MRGARKALIYVLAGMLVSLIVLYSYYVNALSRPSYKYYYAYAITGRRRTEAYRRCDLKAISVVSRIIDGSFKPEDYRVSPKQTRVRLFDAYIQDILLLRYSVPVYRRGSLNSILSTALPASIAVVSIALLFALLYPEGWSTRKRRRRRL